MEHTARWRRSQERIAERPLLRDLTFAEWREMLDDADPPSDDDVPWRFPVRVPLRHVED
jgi:hypothetical protein